MVYKRRKTDEITDKLIDEVTENGESEKRLIARMYLEIKVSLAEIKSTLGFHGKFIWACIITLLTAFIGGIVTGIFVLVQRLMGG